MLPATSGILCSSCRYAMPGRTHASNRDSAVRCRAVRPRENHRLVQLQTIEHLDPPAVVEPGLDREPLRLAIGDRERRLARLLDHQRVARDQQSVRLALDDEARAGIHAGAQLAFWIG